MKYKNYIRSKNGSKKDTIKIDKLKILVIRLAEVNPCLCDTYGNESE